jgi:acyl-CoA thioesterase-1
MAGGQGSASSNDSIHLTRVHCMLRIPSVPIPELILALVLALFITACGSDAKLPPLANDAVILAFGNSLTYGTGAKQGEDYPNVLAQATGRTVVNEGIPGEESDAGLARLPAVLDQTRPDLVILGHGGNDLLRKRNLTQTQTNLRRMAALAQAQGASVVLLGIPKPGLFLGTHPMYRELAEELGVPLEDGALADILSDAALKTDSIHPNASGYAKLAAALHELLRRSGALD